MSKEYIEREVLLKDISETVLFSVRGGAELPTPEMRGSNKVIDRIKSAPADDVVEVRHGEWAEMVIGEGFYCVDCGECANYQHNYCPWCGAKMDGKGEGE